MNMKLLTKKKRTVLGITRLDERINPADIYWTGTSSSDMTIGGNWNTFAVPTTGDVAHIDSTHNTITNPPAVPSVGMTLDDFRIDHYSGTVTLNGDLTVGACTLTDSAASIAGPGTFRMSSGALVMPGSATHHWLGTKVKATSVVAANNYLEINGTGQIGPDAGTAAGSLSDYGHVDMQGNIEVGYTGISVNNSGELDTWANCTLENINHATAGTHSLFSYLNGNNVFINQGSTLDIKGGAYAQSAGLTRITQSSGLAVEDTTSYLNGGTGYAKNIDIEHGTVDLYSFGGLTAANGDIGFANNSVLGVNSCSQYDHMVHPPVRTTEHGVGVGVTALTLRMMNSSTIAFVDYTPPDAIAGSVTQEGALLNLSGNLAMSDTSTLSLRANVGKAKCDSVCEVAPGEGAWTIGGSTTLKVDVRNFSSHASLDLGAFLYAGDPGVATITGTFGTKTLTGGSGYSWDTNNPVNNGNEYDGGIHF